MADYSMPDWQESVDIIRAKIPPNVPCCSTQFVKFNKEAAYPEGSGHSPCSGRVAFTERYIKSVHEFAVPMGVGMHIIWEGEVGDSLCQLETRMPSDLANGRFLAMIVGMCP
jgi:hypothetical protein